MRTRRLSSKYFGLVFLIYTIALAATIDALAAARNQPVYTENLIRVDAVMESSKLAK
jgi:hypothetical protein